MSPVTMHQCSDAAQLLISGVSQKPILSIRVVGATEVSGGRDSPNDPASKGIQGLERFSFLRKMAAVLRYAADNRVITRSKQ
jgi:hypothetical protein